jgi:hypothetical protein
MPINVKVISTKDFIRTVATGVLDFASSKQALLDIASNIGQPGQYEVLVDTRDAEATLSIHHLYELGEALANDLSLRRSRIAILTPKEEARKASFFETVAVNRGASVRAFTDFEPAISWLIMQVSTQ